MRRLAASVLALEAFVVYFAVLVAAKLSDLGPGVLWGVGGGFAVVCLLLCGLLRHRWAYTVGWGVQVAMVAAGFVVTPMFFIGAVFTLLWYAALRVGGRIDEVRAGLTAHDAAGAHDAPRAGRGPVPDREGGD